MYGRFALGLRGFLRRRITLDDAKATIEARLASREDAFLRLVERAVFARRKSPYLFLFQQAGCTLGDVRENVRRDGLEPTLGKLHDSGVNVSVDEFKGNVPLRRGGRTFASSAADFDNPFSARQYEVESGGSTGPGTRVLMDLGYLADAASLYAVAYAAHGVLSAPLIVWQSPLPNSASVNNLLRAAILGNIARRWFVPHLKGDFKPPLRFGIASAGIIRGSRMLGVPLPLPETMSYSDALSVATLAADLARREGSCLVRLPVSAALRMGLKATDAGVDLTGVTLMGGGEPASPAKVRGITGSGAKWVPTYVISEAGPIGIGCANPIDGSDVHFFEDILAVVQRRKPGPSDDSTVNEFAFTTLLPSSPKLMINVESDDFGILETRKCGCLLESVGLTRHIRSIGSVRKLTGEGMTLVGTEVVSIVEEILPARFGGSALDYQLVEEEDESGFTHMTVLVSPEISITSENVVVETVLHELGRSTVAGDIARAILKEAGAMRVRREQPTMSVRGKQPAFRTVSKR